MVFYGSGCYNAFCFCWLLKGLRMWSRCGVLSLVKVVSCVNEAVPSLTIF